MPMVDTGRCRLLTRNCMQMFAAIVKCGLKPKDLMQMHLSTHREDIAAFLNTVISAGVRG